MIEYENPRCTGLAIMEKKSGTKVEITNVDLVSEENIARSITMLKSLIAMLIDHKRQLSETD